MNGVTQARPQDNVSGGHFGYVGKGEGWHDNCDLPLNVMINKNTTQTAEGNRIWEQLINPQKILSNRHTKCIPYDFGYKYCKWIIFWCIIDS